MPNIKLSDNASLQITSEALTPGLTHYLQNGLVFTFDKISPDFKQAERIADLDARNFPVSLSADIPGTFAVSSAVLNVQGGGEASIDVLKDDKKQGFAKSLDLDPATLRPLVCFEVGAELQSGPSGTLGDFSFGLLSGAQVHISNYCPVAMTDLLVDATRKAMSGLTLPHDLDDLRALPEGNFCRLEGKANLKFTASVQYKLLNNALAAAPVEILSQSLKLKAESGPKFQVTVEHSNSHQLTIAAQGNNKLRISVSLTADSDIEESFDFSVGVSGNVGSQDALQLLVEQFSSTSDKDLQQIRAFLTQQEQSDLSVQIKTVLQGATKGGISVSLHDALKQSKERNYLFIYDIDLHALDAISAAALTAALKGDFTQITAGAELAGIQEVQSFSTLTLTNTHTLNIHLLGILNFSDVSTFMKKVKVGLNPDTNDIVLAATDIKIVQNTIDPDHLRTVLTKSAMITTGAASSPGSADFTFKMVFFLKKADVNNSDLRQIANALGAVSSPAQQSAEDLLHTSTSKRPDVLFYLSLDLNKGLSNAIFNSRSSDDFVKAGQTALAAILAGDPDSASRVPLLSLDLGTWKTIRADGGSAANIRRLLEERGISNQASVTDFLSIDWWAQAMGNMAAALAAGTPLTNAEKSVLATSQGGFDVPWALLATHIVAGSPPVAAKLSIAGAQPLAMTAH